MLKKIFNYFVILLSVRCFCAASQAVTGCVWLGDDMSFKTDPLVEGVSQQWYAVEYDDSQWATIDSGKSYQSQGYPDYVGITWYRKDFFVPDDWNKKTISLEIGFVSEGSSLYINGALVGNFSGWNLSLGISSLLRAGQNNLICIKVGQSSPDGGLYRDPVQLLLMNPTTLIGLSSTIPVVGKQTQITIYSATAPNRSISITKPDATISTVQLDANAQAFWQPTNCGKYTITYGTTSQDVWVTSKELMFHYWDDSILPKYATNLIGFNSNKYQRGIYWNRSGAKYTAYASGYGHEDKSAEQIQQYWSPYYSNDLFSGITIDELCPDSRPMQIALTEAVLLTCQIEGENFVIHPYIAGLEYDNYYGFWNLRRANAKLLWEDYWGEAWLHQKRWMDMVYTKMNELGGVLSISPGFVQGSISGSLNIEQLRDEFAMLRTIAPQMKGLSFFNGYFRRDLDSACDGFIEDFFLKPLIHIHPKNGKLEFQNIGNSVTPDTITAKFSLNGLDNRGIITLPVLEPDQTYQAVVPSGANRVELTTPVTMENLYVNKYEIPSLLNPLQVVSCSVENSENIELSQSDNLAIEFTFNKNLATFDLGDIVLADTDHITYTAKSAVFNFTTKILTVIYENLPSGYYSMILKSSTSAFKDTSNNPLDGSGDGLMKSNSSQIDDYTLYFSLDVVEEVILLEPVAYWNFNETGGNIATDSQGQYHAQLAGEPLPAFTPNGQNNGCIVLNGNGQYLNAGNVSTENISNMMTVTAWIKVNSFTQADQPIIGKGADSWQITRNASTNGLIFSINSYSNSVINSKNVADGNWHHIAAVYDGSYMKLYVDGIANSRGVDQLSITQNQLDLFIGFTPGMPVSSNTFNGYIDEVAIYDKAFDNSIIRILACDIEAASYHWSFDNTTGNTAKDEMRAKTCTLAGDQIPTWAVADGRFSGTLKFDGDGYVDCGNITNLEDSTAMTITAWIKINTLSGSYQPIMGKGYDGWRILRYGSTDQIMFDINSGQAAVINPVNVNDGRWHHISAVYDGQSISLVVDGVKETANISSAMNQNDLRFIIGGIDGQLTGIELYNGLIDELTVWAKALDSNQIEFLRNALPSNGLLGYWQFDESYGSTAYDYSGFLDAQLANISTSPWRYSAGKTYGAVELQGSEQKIELDNLNSETLSTSMSITLWLKVNQFTDGYQYVCGKGYDTWRILRYAGTNNIMFDMNYSKYKAISPVNVNDGNWHHVAATFDGEKIIFCIDGIITITDVTEPINASSGKLMFGSVANPGGTPSFMGYFDEISYWSRALSYSEIMRAKFDVKHLIYSLEADLSLDWQINCEDFAILANNWKGVIDGNSSEQMVLSDINNDGFIDGGDLSELVLQWLEF